MYIQRVPHPLLAHRDNIPVPSLDAFQTVSSNDNSDQQKPHPTGYIVLAVVLSIALLSLAGYLTARRRSCRCTRNKSKKKQGCDSADVRAPRMRREGRGRLDVVPSLSLMRGSSEDASPAVSSPGSSSEGPLTPAPCDDDHGNIGMNVYSKDNKHDDGASFASNPVIDILDPMQSTDSEITAPDPSIHVHFFDDLSISSAPAPHASPVIRPHGLPLSPVPEESSAAPTLPSISFEQAFFGSQKDHFCVE